MRMYLRYLHRFYLLEVASSPAALWTQHVSGPGINNKKERERIVESHVRISQTCSLLFSKRRVAHHSALRLIHTSRFSSGSSDLRLMQNLKSSSFSLHSDIWPNLYRDFS